MQFESFLKETLWPILVETVHSLVMFPNHKSYVRDVVLAEKPNITPAELKTQLRIPLGEAIVLLYELSQESPHVPKSNSA